MQNKTLIILGMHRSGTSLLTDWLHSCGLPFGDRLLGADYSNQGGHFEDLDFLELHKQILKDNKLTETGLDTSRPCEVSDYFRTKIKHTVSLKHALRSEWGWKEPRTCLFLDEYVQLLPDAYIIVIYRDYNQVVNSLLRRDLSRIRYEYYLTLWGRMKWHIKKKWRWRRLVAEKTTGYLNSWCFYNQSILESVPHWKPGKLVAIDHGSLPQVSEKLFSLLKNWGFSSISYRPFEDVYRPELSRTTSPAAADTHGLDGATDILNRLKMLQEETFNSLGGMDDA